MPESGRSIVQSAHHVRSAWTNPRLGSLLGAVMAASSVDFFFQPIQFQTTRYDRCYRAKNRKNGRSTALALALVLCLFLFFLSLPFFYCDACARPIGTDGERAFHCAHADRRP